MKMINGHQVRMARGALRMAVRELAEMASVDKMTVVRIESGEGARASTFERLRVALETAGVVFIPAVEGVHEEGVAFKWGFDYTQIASKGEGSVTGTSGDGLHSQAWDEDFHATPDDTDGFPPAPVSDELRESVREMMKTVELSDAGRAVLTRDFGL